MRAEGGRRRAVVGLGGGGRGESDVEEGRWVLGFWSACRRGGSCGYGGARIWNEWGGVAGGEERAEPDLELEGVMIMSRASGTVLGGVLFSMLWRSGEPLRWLCCPRAKDWWAVFGRGRLFSGEDAAGWATARWRPAVVGREGRMGLAVVGPRPRERAERGEDVACFMSMSSCSGGGQEGRGGEEGGLCRGGVRERGGARRWKQGQMGLPRATRVVSWA